MQLLRNPEGGQRLSRAAGHDELPTVAVPKTSNHVSYGCGLMRTRFFSGQRPRGFANASRPIDLGIQQIASKDQTDRYLLTRDGFSGVSTDVVRRGDDQSEVELGPV